MKQLAFVKEPFLKEASLDRVELRAAKIPSLAGIFADHYWLLVFHTVKTTRFRNVIDGRYGNMPTATIQAGAIFIRIFWIHTKALATGHHN